MRYLDKEQRTQIGFEYIINSLQLMTILGTELASKVNPYGKLKKEKLITELENLEKVKDVLLYNKESLDIIETSFCKFNDIRKTITLLSTSYVLDEVELFEIKHFAKLVNDIKKAYEKTDLKIDVIQLYDLSDLFNLLDPEKTGIVTFHIYEAYSSKLKAIREKKKVIEQKIGIASEIDKPILLEERLIYVVEEDEEEQLIKKNLSIEICKYKDSLAKTIESIGYMDFYIAKAKLARDNNCSKPIIEDEGDLIILEAENLMVKETLSKKNKKFTPISIRMNEGVTILTGANMGGKSVTIKTIVLNVMLAQSGFYVFAQKVQIPIYDFVYYVSDDLQSIEKGLSTFGAEILRLKIILSASKVKDGFIALDELARGTNPREGRDIVQAIVIYLKNKKSQSLISTHYDGIMTTGVRHYQVIGLRDVNYSGLKCKVELSKKSGVDIIQEHMDYRIAEVKDGIVPKDALNVAALLGLDKEILETIEGFYKS